MADMTDENRAARAISLLEKALRVVERFVTRGAEEMEDIQQSLEEAIARLEELEFDKDGRLLVEGEGGFGEDEANDAKDPREDAAGEDSQPNCRSGDK